MGSSCTVCIADEFIFVDIPEAPVHGPMNFVRSQRRETISCRRLSMGAVHCWQLAALLSSFRAKPGCPKNSLHTSDALHAV